MGPNLNLKIIPAVCSVDNKPIKAFSEKMLNVVTAGGIAESFDRSKQCSTTPFDLTLSCQLQGE